MATENPSLLVLGAEKVGALTERRFEGVTMSIRLLRAGMEDCNEIHRLQTIAFCELLKKYKDTLTNPGAETVEKIMQRMAQPFTDYYFIRMEDISIGALRVKNENDEGMISPVFVLPEYQGKGYGQEAILMLECLYPRITKWQLETIKEEEHLCRFYEKLGYHRTGRETPIQEGMTIVGYEKFV